MITGSKGFRKVASLGSLLLISGFLFFVAEVMGVASAHAGRIWLKGFHVVNGDDDPASGPGLSDRPVEKKVVKGDDPSAHILIINDVDLEKVEDVLRVVIAASVPIKKYHLFFLDRPLRLVIDLSGKWKNSGRSSVAVKNDVIRMIRVGEQTDRLRFVIDLKTREQPSPIIEELPRGLSLILKKKSGFFR